MFVDLGERREIDYGSEREDVDDREKSVSILKQVM